MWVIKWVKDGQTRYYTAEFSHRNIDGFWTLRKSEAKLIPTREKPVYSMEWEEVTEPIMDPDDEEACFVYGNATMWIIKKRLTSGSIVYWKNGSWTRLRQDASIIYNRADWILMRNESWERVDVESPMLDSDCEEACFE